MKKRIASCVLILAVLSTTLLIGYKFLFQKKDISKSGFYFNTVITVTLYDSSKEALLDDCFSMADTYESYFSNKIADSDICKINDADGEYVEVHDETIELLEKGIYYGNLSNGKFDITVGALSDLWDFSNKALIYSGGPENIPESTNLGTEATTETISNSSSSYSQASMIPSADEIASALSTVNYKNVKIDGNKVALTNPDATLDLGGIAKGYIADEMKAYLNEKGITSGVINLGGNVLVLGPKEDGDVYRIGIQKPFDEDGASIASVSVTDQTVVSSGVYERYFKENGVLYHHILDTATGYPYENGLLGVTIITGTSVDGDGLSTTCFALGLEDGMALIESLPDTEAIFITDDYELHCSSGMGTSIPYQKL